MNFVQLDPLLEADQTDWLYKLTLVDWHQVGACRCGGCLWMLLAADYGSLGVAGGVRAGYCWRRVGAGRGVACWLAGVVVVVVVAIGCVAWFSVAVSCCCVVVVVCRLLVMVLVLLTIVLTLVGVLCRRAGYAFVERVHVVVIVEGGKIILAHLG